MKAFCAGPNVWVLSEQRELEDGDLSLLVLFEFLHLPRDPYVVAGASCDGHANGVVGVPEVARHRHRPASEPVGPLLQEAIGVIARGESLLDPAVTRSVVSEFVRSTTRRPDLQHKLDGLTARENDILRMLASGLSNAEIAEELVLSPATVKAHVGHVLTKLDVRSRVQAVVLAYEAGLIRT